MPPPATPQPNRFHVGRPDDLRRVPRWHPLAHIIRRLPVALEGLAHNLRVGSGDRVLDYGCAERPYRHFFSDAAEYIGADLPGNPDATVEISADGRLPLEDESFDAVLSTQVLEHVTDPALYLSESYRVLRPGGRMLLSTHGIMVYHPDPVDLWRWTCEGLERIVGEAGFEIERFEGVIGLGATGMQLLQDSILWRLSPRLHAPVALVFQALVALADRLDTDRSRSYNSLVFAVVARKPGEGGPAI